MSICVLSVKEYLVDLQNKLCNHVKSYENKTSFQQDLWERGDTRVLKQGQVFESAGVNFSHVKGDCLPVTASSHRPELAGRSFEAMGVSCVFHPLNPYVPTTHMNVRFFMATQKGAPPVWWFGGGFDLTPYYPFMEDVIHFHQTAKKACDPFGEKKYAEYKAWADKYFYLPHRQETRGVGGLFFDDVNENQGWDFEKCFGFMQSVGNHFWPAFGPLVERRLHTAYTERERQFQCYRRGRYVEFNLLYDRGTLFGLQSGGRTESILMSLPPQVMWQYGWDIHPGSPESVLYEHFLQPQHWLDNV